MSRRSSRAACLVAGVAGAAAVLVASGRDWVTVPLPAGGLTAHADGRTAAPAAVAVALVAAAGTVALVTAGRLVRPVVAGLLLLAGAGVVALSVAVWTDPLDAAGAAVLRVTGTVGRPDGAAAAVSGWPAVSAAGGVLVAAAGALGAVRGRRWPAPSRRYERAGPGTAAQDPSGDVTARPRPVPPATERDRRTDTWDSLSRGEDPTDGG